MAEAKSESKKPVEPTGDESENGKLPVGTADQILDAAPSDLVTETLEIPEWKCSVRVRSLTAAQSARVKQAGLRFKGDETAVAWAEMEIMQFQEGVLDPSFRKDQVRRLYGSSGKGFQRVIGWLDEHSGLNKEELRQARDEFPGPGDGDEG